MGEHIIWTCWSYGKTLAVIETALRIKKCSEY